MLFAAVGCNAVPGAALFFAPAAAPTVTGFADCAAPLGGRIILGTEAAAASVPGPGLEKKTANGVCCPSTAELLTLPAAGDKEDDCDGNEDDAPEAVEVPLGAACAAKVVIAALTLAAEKGSGNFPFAAGDAGIKSCAAGRGTAEIAEVMPG